MARLNEVDGRGGGGGGGGRIPRQAGGQPAQVMPALPREVDRGLTESCLFTCGEATRSQVKVRCDFISKYLMWGHRAEKSDEFYVIDHV